jgi:hypothetical protein
MSRQKTRLSLRDKRWLLEEERMSIASRHKQLDQGRA